MATRSRKKISIGDLFRVQLGPTSWRARIVEDRGNLGRHGMRMYRVELLDDVADPPLFVEVGKDELKPLRN
ncbi:MAG TPA: hypothetical protein VHQ47_08025 [Phycisphaerae bacterium]|jgi:hypothetical protein|nr:hypothetical protein [Phycisphaerae bacterium]